MGFPSPATDYEESRLSLDALCNTRGPSIYFFKAAALSRREGIKEGAVLVVNKALTPGDGSIIAARINGDFRIVRYRTVPRVHLEELDHPERRIQLNESELAEEDDGLCFGVITHVLNDIRATGA